MREEGGVAKEDDAESEDEREVIIRRGAGVSGTRGVSEISWVQ